MAAFTTRVQLNGRPTADDYEKLHKAMKKRGFSRVIQSDEPRYYWLPNAEYNRQGAVTAAQVLADARAAGATVSSDVEILVSEATLRTWHGLKLASQADALAS